MNWASTVPARVLFAANGGQGCWELVVPELGTTYLVPKTKVLPSLQVPFSLSPAYAAPARTRRTPLSTVLSSFHHLSPANRTPPHCLVIFSSSYTARGVLPARWRRRADQDMVRPAHAASLAVNPIALTVAIVIAIASHLLRLPQAPLSRRRSLLPRAVPPRSPLACAARLLSPPAHRPTRSAATLRAGRTAASASARASLRSPAVQPTAGPAASCSTDGRPRRQIGFVQPKDLQHSFSLNRFVGWCGTGT